MTISPSQTIPRLASTVQMRFAHYEMMLREKRVRMTQQRRIILTVLAQAEDHPDALELYQRAHALDSSVALSTVYRTVKLLEEHGALLRHTFEDGRARFEQTDREHHDHLIDIDTGQVIEFHSQEIEKLQAQIAADLGYDIVRHRLELYVRKQK